MISARAVALQGIGFSALFIAVQGITPVAPPAPPPTQSVGSVLVSTKDDYLLRLLKGTDDDELICIITAFLHVYHND